MSSTADTGMDARPTRAIVIDDDPSLLFYIRQILQGRGYEVKTYESPAQSPLYKSPGCPCVLQGSCPDVIISDFNMPGLNGVELLERCKKKGCRCRHLALISGNRLEEHQLIRLAKYGTRFFSKPLELDEFSCWLDRVELDLRDRMKDDRSAFPVFLD